MDLESGRIESWKAIAGYLKCSEKAARGWARERGLPVYRHPGLRRSRVYAFQSELDRWLKPEPRRDSSEAALAGGSATTTATETALAPSADERAIIPLDVPPGLSNSTTARRIALAALLAIGSVSLLAVATKGTTHRENPVSLRTKGATLEALDAMDRPIWSHVFGAPFSTTTPAQPLSDRSWIGDLDGDGNPEVLFFAAQPAGDGAIEDTLYCFDSVGKELWSFRLEDTIKFRTRDFGPPWFLGLLSVYDLGGEKRIALSMAVQKWWPAALLTLDGRGRRLTTFVSSGLIYGLRTTVREGRPLILATGVSNSHAAASLIVLAGENPVGTTIEERGSAFECLSCAAGAPLRYFSFPKTELAVAANVPYNYGVGIRTSPLEIEVGVLEITDSDTGPLRGLTSYFLFDANFRLTDARPSDSFASDHTLFEKTGVLRHTAAACRNRVPRVRVFEPGRGLVDLPLSAGDRKAGG